MEYAYLGDVTNGEFNDIREFFPAIVGIGTFTDLEEKCTMISLGVSKELPEQVIGFYQLLVLCWNDDAARQTAYNAAMDS